MPLLDSVILANPRGGSGKSTLVFHLSTMYAKLHPEMKVVVLDASAFGDSSALLLGSHETRRQLLLDQRNAFVICHLARIATSEGLNPEEVISGEILPIDRQPEDFYGNLLKASDFNPNDLPSNLYLCAGGDIRDSVLSQHRVHARVLSTMVKGLRKALVSTKENVVIFSDTDGGEMDPITAVMLGVNHKLVIPISPFNNDVVRAHGIFRLLSQMEGDVPGLLEARLHMLLFTPLDSTKNEPYTLPEPIDVTSPVKMPKLVEDQIAAQSQKFFEDFREADALFRSTTAAAFYRDCFYGVKNFKSEMASAAMGVPVWRLKNADMVVNNMTEILKRLQVGQVVGQITPIKVKPGTFA